MKEKLIEVLNTVDLIAFNDWLTDTLEVISKTNLEPLRAGQYLFNEMYRVYPQVADTIRATTLDMFYVDSKIEDFVVIVDELINTLTV